MPKFKQPKQLGSMLHLHVDSMATLLEYLLENLDPDPTAHLDDPIRTDTGVHPGTNTAEIDTRYTEISNPANHKPEVGTASTYADFMQTACSAGSGTATTAEELAKVIDLVEAYLEVRNDSVLHRRQKANSTR